MWMSKAKEMVLSTKEQEESTKVVFLRFWSHLRCTLSDFLFLLFHSRKRAVSLGGLLLMLLIQWEASRAVKAAQIGLHEMDKVAP